MLVRMLSQLITIPLIFISCNSEKEWPLTDPDPPQYAAIGIVVQQDRVALIPGGTFKADASVTPKYSSDTLISWESSNNAVATVNNQGLITAAAPGDVNIIARTKNGNFADTVVVR